MRKLKHQLFSAEELTNEAIQEAAVGLVLRCKAVGVEKEAFMENMETLWNGIMYLGNTPAEEVTSELMEALQESLNKATKN